MNLNALLMIDIETVPQHRFFDELDPEWQQLWAEKSAKLLFQQPLSLSETYPERAGIFAEFGKIICISSAYFFTDGEGKQKLRQKTISNDNELQLLRDFLVLCEQFIQTKKELSFAGHNIREFDIPYICRRLIIHNIPLPKYLNLQGLKPWENTSFDTLHWWRFGDYKNYITLKLLAATLGIQGSKGDLDGSQVRDAYYNRNALTEIALYCAKDVQVVAQVILKYFNKPLLNEEDFIA
jgi:DNA polymerase elongation subunit (family B)